MTTLKNLIFAVTSVASLAAASPAFADFVFDLNVANVAGYTGPYDQVDVALVDPTHATITFTALTGGGDIFLMGDGGTVGVNVNATSWTLGTIAGSNAGTGFTPGGPWSNGGAGNEDGYGSFNQTINTFDGFTHSSDTITFGLTDTGGTWSSANSVLTGNSQGNIAATHVFPTVLPANASNGVQGMTFFASGFSQECTNGATNFPLCTTSVVPEPASMVLLGSGLLGLGVVLRRRYSA